jgi:hypothetical protein
MSARLVALEATPPAHAHTQYDMALQPKQPLLSFTNIRSACASARRTASAARRSPSRSPTFESGAQSRRDSAREDKQAMSWGCRNHGHALGTYGWAHLSDRCAISRSRVTVVARLLGVPLLTQIVLKCTQASKLGIRAALANGRVFSTKCTKRDEALAFRDA